MLTMKILAFSLFVSFYFCSYLREGRRERERELKNGEQRSVFKVRSIFFVVEGRTGTE